MKRGKKRGLSGVVTTLILISLSLVAIIIIWIVIRNIVESGSEQVELGQYTLDMEIQKVVENSTGTSVTIQRNAGQGQLTGVKIIISDGTNIYQYDQKNIVFNELETKTFVLNYIGIVKTVSVSPIVKSGNSEQAQNPVDTSEYSNYNAIKAMPGLVSWWRMEGNANDEMGLNDGNFSTLYAPPPLVNGKIGKAYEFITIDQPMIKVTDSASLQLENSNMTIIAWINKTATGILSPIISKGDVRGHAEPGYFVGTTFVSSTKVKPVFGTSNFSVEPNYNITTKTWNHLAFSQSVISPSRTLKIYDNGQLINQTSKSGVTVTSSVGYDLLIGIDNDVDSGIPYESFYGIIDEVMIFNRTLSAQEIQALYNLDLSN